MKRAAIAAIIVIAGVTAIYVNSASSEAAEREVTWLIAHEPVELFSRAAEVFESEYNRMSDGADIRVRIIGPSDIGGEGVFNLTKEEVRQALDSGKADLATMPLAGLGSNSPATALLAPFVFDDIESLSRVLDSDLEPTLLDQASVSGMRALAFTLSGGMQNFISDTVSIRSANDLKGLRIATASGNIAEEAIRSLGAVPVPVEIGTQELFDAIRQDKADAAEMTYTRLSIYPVTEPLIISETNHRVFLTLMFASDAFFNDLRGLEREALLSAADTAARAEREDSIRLAEDTKRKLLESGSTAIEITPAERNIMRANTESVRLSRVQMLGEDILQRLNALR